MAMPSSTAMVWNSRATPPAAATASATIPPMSLRWTWPGTNCVYELATATIGLSKSSSVMPVARHSARAPAMFRPWVVVRLRSSAIAEGYDGAPAPTQQDGAMATALVVQHLEPEGPALIGEALRAAGVEVVVVRPDRGEADPRVRDGLDGLDGVDGLVVMGGPMSAGSDDGFPSRRAELALLRAAVEAEVPTLGVCLGAQLLAAARGGEVEAGPELEVGWGTVVLSDAAAADPLWPASARRSPCCTGTARPSPSHPAPSSSPPRPATPTRRSASGPPPGASSSTSRSTPPPSPASSPPSVPRPRTPSRSSRTPTPGWPAPPPSRPRS